MNEIACGKPDLAYDLAMGLQMMDFHSEALQILALASPSPAVDWLRLELEVRARRFVTALEEAHRLETLYASDPDAAFAATYARARALYGLGEKQTAIDLLRGLVKIRPHYRSAHSLLLDWAGGEA
jgi:tetratricopeptide (TPR) repeat protein